MREARENENLINKVCVSSIGRPGLVVGQADLGWGLAWVGIPLDTGQHRCWSSRKPLVIAENAREFYIRSQQAYGKEFVENGDGTLKQTLIG